MKAASTLPRNSAFHAKTARKSGGSVSTNWRTGTTGITESTMCVASSVMRRPSRLEHRPRTLQLNATNWSVLQVLQ